MTFLKDPGASLDYTIDWSGWLGTDTIATSTWTAATGIVIGVTANTTTSATAWLSSGTVGQIYAVTNHIVTAAGRTDSRTLEIEVQVKTL
jgi:hypothetical protein